MTGLIQGQALSLIFINGIKVLIITLVLILFIFILIDCLSKEDAADINSGKKENRSIEKERNQNSNEINTPDAGESFAPLTPPVLEVTEKDRGEGN